MTSVDAEEAELLLHIVHLQAGIAARGVDLASILSHIANQLAAILQAQAVIVELCEGEEMVYRAAAGLAEHQLGLRLSQAGSLSGLCVREGGVLVAQDTETDHRVDRDACRRVGLRSMAVSPLTHEGHSVGVIKIGFAEPDAVSEPQARALSLVSHMVGSAIYHASRGDADEIYRRAAQDALTGLANRALFFDRLRQRLARAEREAGRFGLLLADVDDLETIRKTFGHAAGDGALQALSGRLRRSTRAADTVARLGAGEFAILLDEIADEESLVAQARRLTEACTRPFWFRGRQIPLAASLGAVLGPAGDDPESLLREAYRALSDARQAPPAPADRGV